LCHPTCFGHTLDHLQGMFHVQCCFPPCCFVTILLGYVAVSSICVVVMCTCVHMTTTQIEDTATYPCKIVMKQQGGKQHCTRNIPWRWSSVWPKHVGWHNRCRHSNVLKSGCVLMCILKHSVWVGFFKQYIKMDMRDNGWPTFNRLYRCLDERTGKFAGWEYRTAEVKSGSTYETCFWVASV
jgi:hypothetical protein